MKTKQWEIEVKLSLTELSEEDACRKTMGVVSEDVER
jgi:hypothetical protein